MTPSDRPLRWGILGCARITRRGLIPGILGSTSSALLAIASRDGTTATAWAGEFAVPKAYGSYEQVIADPDVDAIYIPLPNELHRAGPSAPPTRASTCSARSRWPSSRPRPARWSSTAGSAASCSARRSCGGTSPA